jgi:hypothetical protein
MKLNRKELEGLAAELLGAGAYCAVIFAAAALVMFF